MNQNKKRVVFYMDEAEYLKFRSILIFKKTHMATWLRKAIAKYVKAHER